MYLGQQQDHACSPAMNSMPTDQPQRKSIGRWCLAGNVEWPGVVSWQIKVVAMMQHRRSDSRSPSGTMELGHACSCTSWRMMDPLLFHHIFMPTKTNCINSHQLQYTMLIYILCLH